MTRRSKYQNKVAGNEKLIIVTAVVKNRRVRAVVSIQPAPTEFRTDRKVLDGANIKAEHLIGEHTRGHRVERPKARADVGIVVASDFCTDADGADIVEFINSEPARL